MNAEINVSHENQDLRRLVWPPGHSCFSSSWGTSSQTLSVPVSDTFSEIAALSCFPCFGLLHQHACTWEAERRGRAVIKWPVPKVILAPSQCPSCLQVLWDLCYSSDLVMMSSTLHCDELWPFHSSLYMFVQVDIYTVKRTQWMQTYFKGSSNTVDMAL